MSSANLENTAWSPRSAAERILMALKMQGALSSSALGEQLGTTGEAARQQLMRLAAEGLVESTGEAKGVGRPVQNWRLTPKAQQRFPDTHAGLTVQLLQTIRSELGEAALDKLISARESQTLAAYTAALSGAKNLGEKLERLAGIRSAEGYMAAVVPGDDGALMLVENHCPICAAATECQNFCRAEKSVFQAVIGPEATVERIEHIVSGARRCAYRVTPA
jgi:predicted ArsR family transcriptional regulator